MVRCTAITYTNWEKEIVFSEVTIPNAEKIGVAIISYPELTSEQIEFIKDVTQERVQNLLSLIF